MISYDDKFDHELPLVSNRAHGGVLTLFKKKFEPYISEIKVDSSRILPLLLEIPGYQKSCHINI